MSWGWWRGDRTRAGWVYFVNFKFALIVAFAAPTLVFVARVLLLKAHTILPAAVVCLTVWFFIFRFGFWFSSPAWCLRSATTLARS